MNDSIALTDLAPGEEAVVESLQGGRGIQHRLRALGIGEGQRVRKLSAVGLGGPVILQVHRAQVAIGRGMARKIFVRRM